MYVFFLFFLVHFFSCCEILNLESSFFLYDHGFVCVSVFYGFTFSLHTLSFLFLLRVIHPYLLRPTHALEPTAADIHTYH